MLGLCLLIGPHLTHVDECIFFHIHDMIVFRDLFQFYITLRLRSFGSTYIRLYVKFVVIIPTALHTICQRPSA
jgi:hypothetical protein